jgi:hypothetical protein
VGAELVRFSSLLLAFSPSSLRFPFFSLTKLTFPLAYFRFCGRANRGDGTPTTPITSTSNPAQQQQSSSAPNSTLLSVSQPTSLLSISTVPSPSDSSTNASSRPSTAPSSSLSIKPSLSVAVPLNAATIGGSKSAAAAMEGGGGGIMSKVDETGEQGEGE